MGVRTQDWPSWRRPGGSPFALAELDIPEVGLGYDIVAQLRRAADRCAPDLELASVLDPRLYTVPFSGVPGEAHSGPPTQVARRRVPHQICRARSSGRYNPLSRRAVIHCRYPGVPPTRESRDRSAER